MSEMELLLRYSDVSCFNPPSGDISAIELPPRSSRFSLFNPASGEISDPELLLTRRCSVFLNSAMVRLLENQIEANGVKD